MAPILKDMEAPVTAPTASTTTAPHSKTTETPSRPQPVAFEVPVTVNGARSVDGSDKRVPFSESTQTVLVFPHGAVVRIATPLTPGQLVFLTNEKSKKEVVCQVIKSKASGNAGAYVEVQFTEASSGFWGIPLSGGASAAAAPRPTTSAPSVQKPAVPAAPVPSKPQATPKPVIPVPVVPPAVKAGSTLPAPSTLAAPHSEAPISVAAPKAVPPAPAVAPTAHSLAPAITKASTSDAGPEGSSAPETASPPNVAASTLAQLPRQTPAVPPLNDYSKQIDALFSAPSTPPVVTAPTSQPTSSSDQPSTDELKQQAARLQAQLSSLLFTERPSAPVPAANSGPQAPANELASKVLGIAQEKREAPVLSIPAPPSKSAPPPLGANEEVKIPSWLAPLSQTVDSAAASATAAPPESAQTETPSIRSEESFDALVVETPKAVVFGGQLLGEHPVPAAKGSPSSKNGLLVGLAAAVIVLVGGGLYLYQTHPGLLATALTHPTAVAAPAEPASSAPSVSKPSSNEVLSAPAPAALPSKPTAPATSTTASSVPKITKPAAAKAPQPVEEEPAKPGLGEVHLAAPVISHKANEQPEGDSLQGIAANAAPVTPDPFGGTSHHGAPAAPIPVGGDVTPARLSKSVAPQYPAIAKSQRIFGNVQLDALIDASGNVANVKAISGPPLLYRAAMDAVKQWKYSPALLNGEPTSTHLTVTVEFRAQ